MYYKLWGVTVEYLYNIQMCVKILLFPSSAEANNNILLHDPARNYNPGCVQNIAEWDKRTLDSVF